MTIKQKLKLLRKRMGMSQLELSEKLGVSRQAVSGWEAGSSRPSTENLQCLSKLYGVPLEVLLDDNQELKFCEDEDKEDKRGEPVVPQKQQNKLRLAVAIIVLGMLVVACTYIAIIAMGKNENKIPLNEIEGGEIETNREKDFDLEWR